MMKRMTLAAALAAIALSGSAVAQAGSGQKVGVANSVESEQSMKTDERGLEFVTSQPANALFSSDLVGYSVYGAGEDKIGDINDILISGDGSVAGVVIGVGGFLGLGEKDVAVTIGSLEMALTEDRYRISIDATETLLMSAPAFERADGTSSDRLGAFERTWTRAQTDASQAIDAVTTRAEELYERAAGATEEATDTVKDAVQ